MSVPGSHDDHYRLLAEHTSDVVLLTDPEHRVRWVAPSVTRALGWTPAELVGHDVADFLHPDGLEHHRRLRAGLSDGSVPRGDFTTRVRTHDGGYRWFTGRAAAVRDEPTGRFHGVALGMRDVTTEKEAEQAATQARHVAELTRISMDAAAVGVLLVSTTGSLLHVNPAFAEMLGRRPADLVGLSFADVTHPDDVAAGLDGVRRLVAGEIAVLRQRKRYRRADGETVWGDVSATPVHDVDGRLDHLVAQVVDVTAEVAAMQRLRTESERFRLLAETASDVVYRTGPDGLIEWISPSVRTVLGWDPCLLVGTPGIALVAGTDQDTATESRATLYTQGRAVRSAVRFRTADGGTRLMAVSARPVLDDDGNVVGGAVGLRDVTEAQQARLALARSERHFRLAMAAAPEGMAISDVDGTFREVNPALARMLRRAPHELPGRSLQDFAAPEAADGVAAARHDLLAGHVDTVHRLVRLEVDGADLWVEHAVSLLEETDAGAPFLIEQFSDRTAATRLQQDLEFQARHDLLTGLSNRADLISRLRGRFLPAAEAAAQAAHVAAAGRVGVLYADVDDFKAINDRFGHAAGDEVLAVVAARIRSCVRLDDVVGRVGGDEFVVVLGGLDDAAELESVAAKVHDAASAPAEVDGVTVPVTISVGATLALPDADPDRVLAAADRALYRAKAAGRDRVVVAGCDGTT